LGVFVGVVFQGGGWRWDRREGDERVGVISDVIIRGCNVLMPFSSEEKADMLDGDNE
jgi:hypothetical protein